MRGVTLKAVNLHIQRRWRHGVNLAPLCPLAFSERVQCSSYTCSPFSQHAQGLGREVECVCVWGGNLRCTCKYLWRKTSLCSQTQVTLLFFLFSHDLKLHSNINLEFLPSSAAFVCPCIILCYINTLTLYQMRQVDPGISGWEQYRNKTDSTPNLHQMQLLAVTHAPEVCSIHLVSHWDMYPGQQMKLISFGVCFFFFFDFASSSISSLWSQKWVITPVDCMQLRSSMIQAVSVKSIYKVHRCTSVRSVCVANKQLMKASLGSFHARAPPPSPQQRWKASHAWCAQTDSWGHTPACTIRARLSSVLWSLHQTCCQTAKSKCFTFISLEFGASLNRSSPSKLQNKLHVSKCMLYRVWYSFKFCFKFISMVLLTQWFHLTTTVTVDPQKHASSLFSRTTRTLKMDSCVCVKNFSSYSLPSQPSAYEPGPAQGPAQGFFLLRGGFPSTAKAPPLQHSTTTVLLLLMCDLS